MSANEANAKIIRKFTKMCGIESDMHSAEIVVDASEIALQIEAEFDQNDTENAVALMLIGYAVMNLGIDRVITDWGWQDPEKGSSPISVKTYTKLTRECFINHFKRIHNDYKATRVRSSIDGSESSGRTG